MAKAFPITHENALGWISEKSAFTFLCIWQNKLLQRISLTYLQHKLVRLLFTFSTLPKYRQGNSSRKEKPSLALKKGKLSSVLWIRGHGQGYYNRSVFCAVEHFSQIAKRANRKSVSFFHQKYKRKPNFVWQPINIFMHFHKYPHTLSIYRGIIFYVFEERGKDFKEYKFCSVEWDFRILCCSERRKKKVTQKMTGYTSLILRKCQCWNLMHYSNCAVLGESFKICMVIYSS